MKTPASAQTETTAAAETKQTRLPRPEASRTESHENGADEFSKRCSIDRIQFLLLAVAQIVVVESGSWETHALCCLIVVQQPLELRGDMSFESPSREIHKRIKTAVQDVQGHTSARAVLQQPAKARKTLTIKTGNKSSEQRLPLQYGPKESGRSLGRARASIGKSNLHGC